MKIQYGQFQWQHLLEIDLGEQERRQLAEIIERSLPEHMQATMVANVGVTAYAVEDSEKPRPIGAGGMIIDSRRTAHCWLMLSDEMRRHRFALFRSVKRALRKFSEMTSVDTIEAIVDPDMPCNMGFLHSLGFEDVGPRQGILKTYRVYRYGA